MATGVRVTRLSGLRERATGVDEEQGQAEVKPRRRLKMNAKSMSRLESFIVSVRKELANSATGISTTAGYVGDCVLGV